jgi:hypothetical protein
MKYFTAALFAGTAFAQTFTGIPVLKGSLKTKTLVRGVSSTCKVKVARIRNLKVEDSFGNPGYTVQVELDLNGKNDIQETVVRYGKDFTLTNFWQENGQTVVRDFDYYSEDGALLSIKSDGRLKTFSFPFDNQKITCAF